MAASLLLKDLEALVKWMSPYTNLLVHNLIHKIFLDIYLSQIKDDCVCTYVRVRILAPKMTSLIKQIG